MSDKSLIIKIVVLMIVSFTMGVFLSKVPQNLRLSILEQQIKKYCSSDPCVLIDFEIVSDYKYYAVGDSFTYHIKIENIGNNTINDVFVVFLNPTKSFDPFPEGKEISIELVPGEIMEYPTKEDIANFPQTYIFREIAPHHLTIKPSKNYTHFFDWQNPGRGYHGMFVTTFDVISYSARTFQQISERNQWIAIGISVAAIIVSSTLSTISIKRSKNLQQASFFGQMSSIELQHRMKINELLLKYKKKRKLSKTQKEEIETLLLLHLNVYETLAYSVNNGFIEEKVAYRMWHAIIKEIYQRFLPVVERGNFEELMKLINGWKIKYKW